MKRIVWLTDIHLNFLLDGQVAEFLEQVAAARPDALVVSGDIGESHNVGDYLARMDATLAVPIYFVLGNHDFYFGSIYETRSRVTRLCASHPRLHYLTEEDALELTAHVGIVGHDAWADGRLGDYARSLVVMHDWKLIAEFSGLDKRRRLETVQALADEAAAHLRRVLALVFAGKRDAVLVTHVPPFREACWHEGALSDDQWMPHFTCQATGQAIVEFMRDHPDKRLTVLCGHTHGQGECQPLPNVQVVTGGAQYGAPTICRVLEL